MRCPCGSRQIRLYGSFDAGSGTRQCAVGHHYVPCCKCSTPTYGSFVVPGVPIITCQECKARDLETNRASDPRAAAMLEAMAIINGHRE